jgi:capsular exopolysaccharide synthesis family protein
MSVSSQNNHFGYQNGTNGTGPKHQYNGVPSNQMPDDDEIDLLKLFTTLFRYKWTLIAFVVVFSIIAAVAAIMQIPIYSSEGTIFISESKNRYSYAGSDLSNLLTTTYGIGVGSTIANELQILKSRTLSEDLADSLMQVKFASTGHKFPLLWRAFPEDSTSTARDTVAMRIRANIKAEKIDPATDVVRISFESPLPEEAAFVVNLTMDTYSKLSTEQNRLMASSALSFLKGERTNFENQLNETEQSLEEFMDRTGLITIDAQTQQLITTLTTLETKKQEVQTQLVAVNSGLDSYQNQLDQIRPGLSEQISSGLGPTLERYQFVLSELETEKLLLLAKNPELRSTTRSPKLNELNAQIADTKAQVKKLVDELLSSESELSLTFLSADGGGIGQRIISLNQKILDLKVQQSQFSTQVEVIRERIAELDAEFDSLPQEITQLARLKRDVKINEQLYMSVSKQYSEMSLWERTQFGMGRPLDYAVVQSRPIQPRKKLWVVIGFLLGGILGVGVIFIREATNDKISSVDELKAMGVPFLGNVPDFNIIGKIDPKGTQTVGGKAISNQLLTFIDHISPISEAYRRIRINTVYANPDKQFQVLMVTSSNKGEGKSTFAANLAITFAEAEKKVLVVDLDLRRPTQHKIFGESREPGLVELLFEDIGFDVAKKETVMDNVDLITVGMRTPEPATVLDSKRLKELMDKLKKEYDHIILDTAPYGIISDSASLLRLVDGLILMSRFNVTNRKELEFTIQGLQHLNADIVGTVLNAFDPKKSSDYYYNYSYYKRAYKDYYQEENA